MLRGSDRGLTSRRTCRHPRDDDPEQSAKAAATVAGVFARSPWPEIDEALDQAWTRRAARPDLAAMSDTELVKYARTVPAGPGAGLDLARLFVAVGQPRPGPAGRPGGRGGSGGAVPGPHRRSWRPGVRLPRAGTVDPLPAGKGIPRAVCAIDEGAGAVWRALRERPAMTSPGSGPRSTSSWRGTAAGAPTSGTSTPGRGTSTRASRSGWSPACGTRRTVRPRPTGCGPRRNAGRPRAIRMRELLAGAPGQLAQLTPRWRPRPCASPPGRRRS